MPRKSEASYSNRLKNFDSACLRCSVFLPEVVCKSTDFVFQYTSILILKYLRCFPLKAFLLLTCKYKEVSEDNFKKDY